MTCFSQLKLCSDIKSVLLWKITINSKQKNSNKHNCCLYLYFLDEGSSYAFFLHYAQLADYRPQYGYKFEV